MIDKEERTLLLRLTRKLVKAREESGLTQLQVSDFGFVSQGFLSKIENGTVKVSYIMIFRLSKIYNKGIDYFDLSK